MIKFWKWITGIDQLEADLFYARRREQAQLERTILATAEYNKMEKVIRENSKAISEWALERMDLTNRLESAAKMIDSRDCTIETLERKLEELKKQIRAERNEAND